MQIMETVGHAPIAAWQALWAFLSAFAGLLAGAVAAHPVVAVLGALYVAGWVWLVWHIKRAPTQP